jgi:ribosomal protein S18 acetylase RimI-like enzyme
MIKVGPVKHITMDEIKNMGFNGYKTKTIYDVSSASLGNSKMFHLEEVELNNLYVKEWSTTNKSLEFFNDIATKGYSVAAYADGIIVGFSIMSYMSWNNTMWIENFRVSEDNRGQGIGKLLIDESIRIAKNHSVRILGLETQSTNYPAIKFYQKCGFELSGVDLYRYPQRENDLKQIGILMAIEI